MSTTKITIAVRVRPGASGTRVGGRYEGPYGPALTVAVTEPAVDGRATEAARRAVAKALGLRAADVTVQLGATSRDKLFTVFDPPTDLADRLAALLNPQSCPNVLPAAVAGSARSQDFHRFTLTSSPRLKAGDSRG